MGSTKKSAVIQLRSGLQHSEQGVAPVSSTKTEMGSFEHAAVVRCMSSLLIHLTREVSPDVLYLAGMAARNDMNELGVKDSELIFDTIRDRVITRARRGSFAQAFYGDDW